MNNWLLGGAFFGVITGCWGYIKSFAWRICNLFIQNVELKDDVLTGLVIDYLLKNYRKSFICEKIFYHALMKIPKQNLSVNVAYEVIGKKPLIFFNGIFPIFWTGKDKSTLKHKKNETPEDSIEDSPDPFHTNILFIRGTLDIDKLIEEACKLQDKNKPDNVRFFVTYIPSIEGKNISSNATMSWYTTPSNRLIGYNGSDFTPDEEQRLLDTLVFSDEVTNYIDEIKLWRKSKDWYKSKGIPWKRGWLLYGPPGSGKSCLVRALGEYLDMPIFVYMLGEVDNPMFIRRWQAMQHNTPCIALIEDIDNVFDGRKNISTRHLVMDENKKNNIKGKLDFDVFLNCIDGIERSEGIFTVITTNDVTKIDSALGTPDKGVISTRPGRLDKAIYLGYLGKDQKIALAKRILGEYPEDYKNILSYIEEGHNETAAQFQEKCSNIALMRYWNAQR